MSAFTAHFFSSAKALGLVLSAVRAARMRRRVVKLRRERAARVITVCFQRHHARRKLSRIQQRNGWLRVLDDLLHPSPQGASPSLLPSSESLDELRSPGKGMRNEMLSAPEDLCNRTHKTPSSPALVLTPSDSPPRLLAPFLCHPLDCQYKISLRASWQSPTGPAAVHTRYLPVSRV